LRAKSGPRKVACTGHDSGRVGDWVETG